MNFRKTSMADTKEKQQLQERKGKKEINRGPWRPDEDHKLAEAIDIHGAKNWTAIAAKAGLNRCAKSCRLRWMNYLRPNIKRGNISDQEEDLIIRLHRLLGNRWSLIAARLPGRTDNEIKNYWNYHLSKKKLDERVLVAGIAMDTGMASERDPQGAELSAPGGSSGVEDSGMGFDVDKLFDFSNHEASTLEWITEFLDTNDD